MSVNNLLTDTSESDGSVDRLIKNHLFISYLVITYVVCWGAFIPIVMLVNHYAGNVDAMVNETPIGVLLLVPIALYIGLVAPAISAIILTGIERGKMGLREYINRVLKWRVGIKWFLVVFLFAFGINFVNNIIHVLLGGAFPQPFTTYSLAAIASLFLENFLIHGGQEELGWRGYAQPKLQTKYDATRTTLIIGFFWGFLHLPMFYLMGDPNYGDNFLLFLLALMGLSFLFTIIYNSTESILMPMLFHALINTLGPLMTPTTELMTAPRFWETSRIIGVILLLVCIGIGILRSERVARYFLPGIKSMKSKPTGFQEEFQG